MIATIAGLDSVSRFPIIWGRRRNPHSGRLPATVISSFGQLRPTSATPKFYGSTIGRPANASHWSTSSRTSRASGSPDSRFVTVHTIHHPLWRGSPRRTKWSNGAWHFPNCCRVKNWIRSYELNSRARSFRDEPAAEGLECVGNSEKIINRTLTSQYLFLSTHWELFVQPHRCPQMYYVPKTFKAGSYFGPSRRN